MPGFSILPAGNIQTGQVTGNAGVKVALSSYMVKTRCVTVRALSTNTQPVVVGRADVAVGTGYKMAPTDPPVRILIDDLAKLNIIPAVNGEGVSYLAELDV
ncbi:MAG TPA: hypothetical protein VGL40_03695 [Bacillota bacterium]|jgi:hypothetical protein